MLDRTSAPPFSKDFSFELPHPEIVSLRKGLDLVFLDSIQQDVFKLEVIFNAGKWHETKTGLSHFTAILLDKGTSSKTSNEIAGLFDYHGSQLEISPGYDFVSVALFGLKKNFDKVFPLFWEILTTASFPGNEFDLQRDIFIQNLKVNNEKTSFVSSKLLRRNVFGSQHPYGSSIEENDVTLLSTDHLSAYFDAYFLPQEIYLAGNFDDDQVRRIAQQFGASGNAKRVEKEPMVISGLQHENVSKSGSVQSSIRLGKRTLNKSNKDYFALILINHILGGYFGSRLMRNIREEKGLTYGIYSSISPFKNDSLFSIGADVAKDKLDLALSEIKKEVMILIEQLVSTEELNTARNQFLGSLQLEVANPFSALDKIKNIRLNNLDHNYYKNLFSRIQQLEPDHLREIGEKYLSTDDLFEVSVG